MPLWLLCQYFELYFRTSVVNGIKCGSLRALDHNVFELSSNIDMGRPTTLAFSNSCTTNRATMLPLKCNNKERLAIISINHFTSSSQENCQVHFSDGVTFKRTCHNELYLCALWAHFRITVILIPELLNSSFTSTE